MKKFLLFLSLLFLFSCSKTEFSNEFENSNSSEIFNARNHLALLGFDLRKGIFEVENGFMVENDIFIRKEDVPFLKKSENGLFYIDKVKYGINKLSSLPNLRDYNGHYYESQLWVTPGFKRDIKIYLSSSVSGSLSDSTVQVALDRFNVLNLNLTFSLVNYPYMADIIVNGDPSLAYLMAAGFPYLNSPYDEILVNTSYNFDIRNDGASIFAHELGHCIGFRHTDYMDRSFSCGGPPDAEYAPAGGHISGSPIGPSLNSWMLACVNGVDRPFTVDDIQALNALYASGIDNYVYVSSFFNVQYDNSTISWCCDYVDIGRSITVYFYSDNKRTIPYTTSGAFSLKAEVKTSMGTTTVIYPVPNGVTSYTLPDLEIQNYILEFGNLVYDNSASIDIISVPYQYTTN